MVKEPALKAELKNLAPFLGLLLLALGACSSAFGASESPQAFTFQGRLFTADGSAPLTKSVSLTLGVFSPNGLCLLYQESQVTMDLGITDGMFSVQVGSPVGDPKRTAGDSGLTMAQVFANKIAVLRADDSGSTATCIGGYTPSAGNVRKLRVTVTPAGEAAVTRTSPCLQIKVLSPQQLQCVTPAHTHGQTTVLITLPDLGAGSKTASLALAFNYQDTTKDLAGYAITPGGITASGNGILMRATIGESGSLQQNGPAGSNIQAQTGVHGLFFSRTH